MSNSSLVDYTLISPNKHSPRNHAIDRITIHCVVGQVTVERLGQIFQPTSREASSNYGIGYDGRIGLYVDEKDRSWCSSSAANDNRAVTIEVASDTKAPYAVTDEAFNSILDLCEDICRRNGKTQLLWFGDKDFTLKYEPKPNEMVMTVHRWFAAKECPGAYLYERHPYIASKVTERLNTISYDDWKKYMDKYLEDLSKLPADSYAVPALNWAKNNGLMVGDNSGNQMPQSFLKREDLATILYGYNNKFNTKSKLFQLLGGIKKETK